MRDKILAELKKKFPGLSNELLGLVADKMATKVTADDQLQGAIAELDNSPIPISEYAAFLQKEGDRRVSEATKTHERTLREKYDFKEKTKIDPPPPNDPPKNDIEAMQAQLRQLTEKLTGFETKEQRQAWHDALMKKLGEKKIPAVFAKGKTLESADQIDAVLAEIEADYTEVKQGFTNEGLMQQPLPPGSEGRTDNIDADIAAWAAKK